MQRLKLGLLLLVICLCNGQIALTAEELPKTNAIKNSLYDENSYCDSGKTPGLKTYRLSTDSNRKTTVAVIQISHDGSATCKLVDSQHKVTDLDSVTLKSVEQEWGRMQEKGQTKTFVLWTQIGDRNPYTIDTKFSADGKLSQYCVKGKEISSACWIKI